MCVASACSATTATRCSDEGSVFTNVTLTTRDGTTHLGLIV